VIKEVVAVDGISLTINSGEVFALLGHNGAGKTTTISILTGLFPLTSGNAHVFGKSVSTEMDEIRKMLGVCPQHDILFPNLTAYEHLALYSGIKGVPKSELDAEIKTKLKEVGLENSAHDIADTFSGGMKRKLSVAIAFIGSSQVIFLDEPTTGMDAFSRRKIWDIIQRNKTDKIIVLTTHFMEEADFLGDKIAIMSKGKIKAQGTSLFLKNHFGIGYHLHIIKNPNFNNDAMSQFIDKYIRGKQILQTGRGSGIEITYQLPIAELKHFPNFLRSLEQNMVTLNMQSYGISITTLEEVFIKIALEDETDAS